MMTLKRTNQLLKAIAEKHSALDFIDGDFLCEHDIRSDELEVFKKAGEIIKGYLLLKGSEQVKIQLLGAGQPAELVQMTCDAMRRQELNAEMAALKL